MEDTLVNQDALTATPVEVGLYELRVADRCDSCGAQAFAVASKKVEGKQMEVLLCGHHLRESTPSLIAQGFSIQDDTHRINEKPSEPDPNNF